MGLIAEYQVSYQHLPLVEVASAVPEMTLRLEIGQPNQTSLPPFIVQAEGEAFEQLEQSFENSAFVREYSLINQDSVVRRYQVLPAASMSEQLGETVEQPAKLRDLASNKSIIGNIIITTSDRVQKWWFADRDEFAEYCEFWRENGESFSLNRLSKSPANEEGNPATRMTDRQREAVLTAYEMGYLAPLT